MAPLSPRPVSAVRVLTDAHTSANLVAEIRRMVEVAFGGDFEDEDWHHTLGGQRVVVFDGSAPVSHAAVVPRVIHIAGHPFHAGYVEAVATRPDKQRLGFGAVVMRRATGLVRATYELGALSTGVPIFYERFGWERWRGPSFVRQADGALFRTPDEDDGLMVLRFGPSAQLNVSQSIACEPRIGDDW
jgi:aminoglycoside 2'-N-acetyltransferase I